MRIHHTASGRVSVVILSGDSDRRREKSFVRVSRLREQAKFLAQLHGLRPSLGPQFAEDTAGMGLDRVLAHIQLLGDLAVAHALGDQFKNVKLAARDAELLSFPPVRNEQWNGRDPDFLHHDPLPGARELDAEPDAKNRKGRRGQSP